jgi:hypothetical protein
MADREQLYTALRNADAAGDTAAAQKLAAYIRSMPADSPAPNPQQVAGVPGADPTMLDGNRNVGKPAAPSTDSWMGKLAGVVEPALAMGSGAIGGTVGALAGMGKSIVGGKYGTQAGVREGEDFGGKVAEALTYQPRTQTGQAITEKAGQALQDSGIVGVPIPELDALARAGRSSAGAVRGLARVTAAAQDAKDAAIVTGPITPLRDLVRKPGTLSGVGAASTPEATLRAQRAASLPVPIPLTKGQLTRDFAQVQFEREAAKTPEGLPLNDRYAQQNSLLGQNMDAFADQTGGQAYSLRAAGRSVVDALDAKAAYKKGIASDLYKQARDAGEMSDLVDVSSLADWIAKNKGKDKLAPIVSTIEGELKQNGKVQGGGLDNLTLTPRPAKTMMTLDASEDLRQAINKLAQPGTPNVVYGSEAKRIIDAAQEGKGGDLYRQARRAYENYANEFENRGVVDKLLSEKRGTKDRSVAYEDVLHHTLLNGSLDDVKHVFRVLEAHPISADSTVVAAGQQAAKDLRGALVNHIKEQTFSNAGADTLGNVVGSEAKLKRIINELDRDGKLEAIYGKQGAQQLRDVRDLATDLYTSPNGTVNISNNANRIVSALNKVAGMGGGVPLVGPAIKYAAKQVQSHSLKKQVNDALMPLSQLPRKP